jgi:L-alanine-DL-glutamate epimerase and related enzymes of enolase superfamily
MGVQRSVNNFVLYAPIVHLYFLSKEASYKEKTLSTTILTLTAHDIRFPTSRALDGSDAMNPAPDYSAAYVIIETDHPEGLAGHGLTFTTGRGNELCVAAINALAPLLIGRTLESLTADMAAFWRLLANDSQLRWLGPEKGVIHLATGAVVNAVWDLWAKAEGKPLWKLLADMTPEEIVACIDFRYITDVLTPAEALELLQRNAPTKASRIAEMREHGYPAYTTAAGWSGYTDERMRQLCRAGIAEGWTHFKLKVGLQLEEDLRRARIMREEIGPDRTLMMDANQVWDVQTAITHMERLKVFSPLWIEEPTSPDDILGHATIARAVAPILVATGEHVQNRIIFKQLFQTNAIGVCQIDACRVGGVNEILAILLLAAKFDVPVCPHAGGVGLCEYVQHLAIFDYISVSASLEHRMIEYSAHLHEHFVDPLLIKNAHYMPPYAPGYSVTMLPSSIADYTYPTGAAWAQERM